MHRTKMPKAVLPDKMGQCEKFIFQTRYYAQKVCAEMETG